MNQPLIKWTGSKRPIAKKIISFFPKEINTYYEPFLGGGSVFLELLRTENIHVKNFILSDVNKELVGIYKLVKNNPEKLIKNYKENWLLLQNDGNHFYKIRDLYNETKEPALLYFLTRTCYNGTIRYNSSGQFNTSFHFGRAGMNPSKIEEVILYYNGLMKDKNIVIENCSFENIIPKNRSDVIYLDPPYTGTNSLYFGNISMNQFKKYISELRCSWFMNINSVNKTDNEERVDLKYTDKILLNSGKSSFSKLKNLSVNVKEYFYYRYI